MTEAGHGDTGVPVAVGRRRYELPVPAPQCRLSDRISVCFLSISAASANIVRFTGLETTETPAYPAAVGLLPFSDQPAVTPFPVFARNSGGTRNILSEGSPFDTGQYLEIGAPNMRVQAQGVSALMTVSFDLFEPSGFTGQTLLGFGTTDINDATTISAVLPGGSPSGFARLKVIIDIP